MVEEVLPKTGESLMMNKFLLKPEKEHTEPAQRKRLMEIALDNWHAWVIGSLSKMIIVLKFLPRSDRSLTYFFCHICFSVYLETIVIVHVDLLHKGVDSQFTTPREQNDLKPQGHVFLE